MINHLVLIPGRHFSLPRFKHHTEDIKQEPCKRALAGFSSRIAFPFCDRFLPDAHCCALPPMAAFSRAGLEYRRDTPAGVGQGTPRGLQCRQLSSRKNTCRLKLCSVNNMFNFYQRFQQR